MTNGGGGIARTGFQPVLLVVTNFRVVRPSRLVVANPPAAARRLVASLRSWLVALRPCLVAVGPVVSRIVLVVKKNS